MNRYRVELPHHDRRCFPLQKIIFKRLNGVKVAEKRFAICQSIQYKTDQRGNGQLETYFGQIRAIYMITVIYSSRKHQNYVMIRIQKNEADNFDGNPSTWKQFIYNDRDIQYNPSDVTAEFVYNKDVKVHYEGKENSVRDLFIFESRNPTNNVCKYLFGIIIDMPSHYVATDSWPFNKNTTAIDLFGHEFHEAVVNNMQEPDTGIE